MTHWELCQAEIAICNIHQDRLEMAIEETQTLFPITVEKLAKISPSELSFLELMTSRFAKLQDTMGQKLFPQILKLLKEDLQNKSFLDYLNILEKIGALPSVEFWIELREVRNSVAHEYPDKPELTVEKLNLCRQKAKELLTYWAVLKGFMQDRLSER